MGIFNTDVGAQFIAPAEVYRSPGGRNELRPYLYTIYDALTATSSTKKADVTRLDDVVELRASVTVCPA